MTPNQDITGTKANNHIILSTRITSLIYEGFESRTKYSNHIIYSHSLLLVLCHPQISTLLYLQPHLIYFVVMSSPTLKAFLDSRKKYVKFTADCSTPNSMNIAAIGKNSVPVSVMDVDPENSLTHRKATSFYSLVLTFDTLKSMHTSSGLIHFVSQQLHFDTSSALQESHSVSMSIRESLFLLNHLKPLAFLDR